MRDREVLQGGGDTDTNACIVGGLLGAFHGINQIPEHFVKAVIDCDTKFGRNRPDFLHPRQIPDLVDTILKIAPNSIQIKNIYDPLVKP